MGLLETIRRCYLTFEDRCLHLGSLGGLCQRVPSPVSAPVSLSPSLPLSSCKDDEALASSSPLFEHHFCSEESSRTQGPEPPQELCSDLVPVSISGASPSPSVLLPSDGLLSASEQGQCSKTEGAPPEREGEPQGEEGLGGGRSQEVSAESRGGACRNEEPGGLCFYAGVSSPSSLPPALSVLGTRGSQPIEQSLDEEPDNLQGAEQNSKKGKKQEKEKKQKKIDTLPAFVRDDLDSSEQLPLEEQSDPLRCEEGMPGDKKEALLSIEITEEKVAGVENGAGEAGAQGTQTMERGGCNIQDLDGFCLTRIMSCLENPLLQACSLVCREWLEASRFARSCLQMQGAPPIATLRKNLTLFPNLLTICLREFQPTSPKGFPLTTLALYGHRIQRLKIVRCEWVSDMGLTAVLKGPSDLRTLQIKYCGGFSGAEAFEGVVCGLEQLELLFCGGVTNEGLGAAAAACPALEGLSVKMEGEGVCLAAGLERFAHQCPQLQKLAVHACGLSDATLRRFAFNCPLLVDVWISCEPEITDVGTVALQLRLPHLTRLTLSNNRYVVLIPCNGRLKALGIGAFSLTADMVLCRNITREKSPEELRIVDCSSLTDATVRKILESCRHLKYVLLHSCGLLTSDLVRAYLESGSTARLYIKCCTGIQAAALPEELQLPGQIFIE